MEMTGKIAAIVMSDLRHDLGNSTAALKRVKQFARLISEEYPTDQNLSELVNELEQVWSELAVTTRRVEEIKTLGIIPCFENINLKPAIYQVISELGLQDKSFLRIEVDCGQIQLYTDLCLLKIVLRQLLQNALQALKEEGEIRIEAAMDVYLNTITIKVSDTGCGIPAEVQQKVFAPGFSFGKIGHSGMGMALVKEALAYINGDISLSSQEEKGTTFSITLPLN